MFHEKMLSYLHRIYQKKEQVIPGLDDTDDQEGLRTLYLRTLTEVFHKAKWQWITTQTKKDRLHLLSVSADLLAYACLIDEQLQSQETVEDTLATLHGPSSQINKKQAQTAALAKYGLHASLLDPQEGETFEQIVIAAAIDALPEYNPNWGGKRNNQAGRPRKK